MTSRLRLSVLSDGEVPQKMFNVITTDTISDLDKFAEPLLFVADRLQVIKSKMVREEHPIQPISSNTVSRLKPLAAMINFKLLQESRELCHRGAAFKESYPHAIGVLSMKIFYYDVRF